MDWRAEKAGLQGEQGADAHQETQTRDRGGEWTNRFPISGRFPRHKTTYPQYLPFPQDCENVDNYCTVDNFVGNIISGFSTTIIFH